MSHYEPESHASDGHNPDCKICIRDLPRDINEEDLQQYFSFYGFVKNVWVARNPSGFAFVEYMNWEDAQDAVTLLNGCTVQGKHVRVERCTRKVQPTSWNRRGPPRSHRGFDPNNRCYRCGDRGHYAYDCRRRVSRRS